MTAFAARATSVSSRTTPRHAGVRDVARNVLVTLQASQAARARHALASDPFVAAMTGRD